MALLAMLIAFGPPMDSAAHAAEMAVESGSTSQVLKFVAAFDVIDDAFDHQPGNTPSKQDQMVVQLAMPEPALASIAVNLVTPVEHQFARLGFISSRTPPPLDRPPRA